MANGATNTITLSLAGIGAVLGAVATGWAALNSRALEQARQVNEYRLGVYSQVVDALNADNPQMLSAAQTLVFTLPEENNLPDGAHSFRTELAILLCDRANAQGHGAAVVRVCSLFSEVPGDGERGTAATPAATEVAVAPPADLSAAPTQTVNSTPAPPAPSAPAPSSTDDRSGWSAQQRMSPTLRDVLPQLSTAGRRMGARWNIDIFHCESKGAAAEQRAQSVFSLLRAATLRNSEDAASLPLGRVRVLPLSESINSRDGYQIDGDIIRAEGTESDAAEQLRQMVSGGNGPALTTAISTTPTPYNLSVFLCG